MCRLRNNEEDNDDDDDDDDDDDGDGGGGGGGDGDDDKGSVVGIIAQSWQSIVLAESAIFAYKSSSVRSR